MDLVYISYGLLVFLKWHSPYSCPYELYFFHRGKICFFMFKNLFVQRAFIVFFTPHILALLVFFFSLVITQKFDKQTNKQQTCP